MNIFKLKSELKAFLSLQRKEGKTIGFVPTMGALHEGHLSLIKRAKKKNDLVVVSIFVNPTQFDNKQDLEKYPQPLDNDIQLLTKIECDVLFTPSVKEIYSDTVVSQKFDFDGLEFQMEGKFRDGHFDGVGTIVKAFFEIVEPDTAYFGRKDFQQLQIIKKLVEKYNIPVKVKGRPIFREEDGLAMSSRNTRLSEEHRKVAPFIYKTLKKAKRKFGMKDVEELTQWVEKKFRKQELLRLEYFTIADEKTLKTPESIESGIRYRAFIAVFAGDIRLIDNIGLQ
ncbi:pantothenate synthetase [Tenacibaculum sp. MAR_2009_124]|uniref:pantoate--beta-alanine ligase n=1 Tax=Tenacibaculum sp. MAR_2009_124 TaxID=1250059 RepID=UPI0008969545|nr:pantoate--beta-alanine ligase [Tenacibaculum sp. MAR_2009_124]SEC32867.1 pantothenate synthetase [Tenacibaculum sp. MAR_2009_124]